MTEAQIFVPLRHPSSMPKIEEVTDITQDNPDAPDDSGSEDGSDADVLQDQTADTQSSSKKKKKKKSKAVRALNALRGQKEIPQELVDKVLSEAKSKRGDMEGLNEENVRQALEEMKVADVVQGRAGISGRGKKDMGEHKVHD